MLFTITNTLSERENRGRAVRSFGPKLRSGWESKRSSEGIRVKRRFSSSEKNHRHRQSRESVSESSRSISGKFGFAAPEELTPIRLLRSRKVPSFRNETSLRKAKKGAIANIPSQNGERKRTIAEKRKIQL
jgi:hypothetical protein